MSPQPNRAQRRREAKLARVKPNRSAFKFDTRYTKEIDTFDTIDRLFLGMRNGQLRWGPSGWLIMGISGEDMDVLSALSGWIDYWRQLADHVQADYDDAALRRLAKSLEYEKPMTMAELDAAAEVVERQRKLYRAIPHATRKLIYHKVKAEIDRENEIRELMKGKYQ